MTKKTNSYWKNALSSKISKQEIKAIDDFETTLSLKKQGKIEDKIFNETRLRRGAYGQRYDNGHRHDGQQDREIIYPSTGKYTKGPNTQWDAPGMLRIKIPYGGLNTKQLETLSDIAEEYSDDILHVTTRQDFQIHYIHIDDTPDIFRRLAAVGITTQEACGNSIRNVTGCPYSGVCPDETFDVTPYAHQTFKFLLGHPDCQDFGRKFKIAFSGCTDHPCAQVQMHDMGFIAKKQRIDGKEQIGFKAVVGGGLGAVPVQAKTFYEFLPQEKLLQFCQAVARIFARYGEKKNRNRARVKFLINDWGIEKFKEEVEKEMDVMPQDKRWLSYLKEIDKIKETPLQKRQGDMETVGLGDLKDDSTYKLWLQNNTRAQKQNDYVTVMISLPLGDLTSNQARKLTTVVRRYVNDTIRTTAEQNMVLRWVHKSDLAQLFLDLKELNLNEPIHNTIKNMVACPGTDTCKLGVASSRGLAGELRKQFTNQKIKYPESAKNLNVFMSGCFNSCGRHHIADIGFYGVSRKVGNYIVPHFQLVLGGQMQENASSYGLGVISLPSKAIPKAIERLTQHYDKNKTDGENFQGYVQRMGKVAIKELLDDLTKVPDYNKDPSYYTDWGDVRTFSKQDIGIGECAGEIVSVIDFALTTAEREVFEAQVAFDSNDFKNSYSKAFQSMLHAAHGLVKEVFQDVKEDYESVRDEFQTRFIDTQIFLDPFAGNKFAKYFLNAKKPDEVKLTKDKVREFMEETQLFIEACHSYNAKKNL